MVQWLGFLTHSAGGPMFNPRLGNEIPHAATKGLNATTKHATMKIEDPMCPNLDQTQPHK